MKMNRQLRLSLGNLPETPVALPPPIKITPLDKEIVKLFKPYLPAKAERKYAFEGIFFDEKGMMATNQHLCLHVEKQTERYGSFQPNGQSVVSVIPKYDLLFEDLRKRNTVKVDLDVVKLRDYLHEIIPQMDDKQPNVYFVAHHDRVVMYNADYLKRIVNTLLSQGVKRAVIRFREDKSIEREAFLIETEFPIGKAHLVLMPASFEQKPEFIIQRGAGYFQKGVKEPVQGMYYFERNEVVMPLTVKRETQSAPIAAKSNKKKWMAMRAKALIIKLKLLNL